MNKSARFEVYRRIKFYPIHVPSRTHFTILESVVGCYARQRGSTVTLKEIAREADVSPPTLKKYFKSGAQIRCEVMVYLRSIFIALVTQNYEETDTASEKLEKYIRACFLWTDELPSHYSAWSYILRFGMFDPELRKQNAAMVDVGNSRIKSFIERGNAKNEWVCANPEHSARKIQVLITGALFSELTELRNIEGFRSQILAMCFEDLACTKKGPK